MKNIKQRVISEITMKKDTIKQKIFITVLLLISSMLPSMNAVAEDGAIRFSNNAFKQVISKADDGSIQYDYVEPKLVLPDDIILYEIVFENISQQPVENIVINNPIANNSSYRANSATGDSTEIMFSVDGSNFASADALIVKDKTGKTWQAKPEDYTVIRWIYKKALQPGEKSRVTYKTTINKSGD